MGEMRLSKVCTQLGFGAPEADCDFETLGKLKMLSQENSLSFLSNERYLPLLPNPMLTGIITTRELSRHMKEYPLGVLVSKNPKETFFQIHQYLMSTKFYGEDFDSQVDSSAQISPGVYIAQKNVKIGRNTLVFPNAVIMENSWIGNNCTIMAGTVIGTDGYEVSLENGKNRIIAHAGKVILEDGVQIESNVVIAKGLFPSRNTLLSEEVTVDNLVHIAHGVKIGKKTKIAAQAMISGSVTIGEDVWIGPGSRISNEITIGNGAKVSIGSVVIKNVPHGQCVTGNFSLPHDTFMKRYAANLLGRK
ncbi:MAG TPA: UDP-3-O-(3-hydroxymyristoyl)glucosamine N-acyltransferase [Thermotogota bacterium]|nr:UDP-3-O-(3-hydroxymyristoyl)glucosamine N-acyltransferase [Thermotogota bacterium]